MIVGGFSCLFCFIGIPTKLIQACHFSVHSMAQDVTKCFDSVEYSLRTKVELNGAISNYVVYPNQEMTTYT